MAAYRTPTSLVIIGVVTLATAVGTAAFSSPPPRSIAPSPWGTTRTTALTETDTPVRSNPPRRTTALRIGADGGDDNNYDDIDGDDDLDEPGTMRVAEIKSELGLRAVDHSDCFDKEALVQRLREARVAGRADPSILDRFNKQRLEDTFQDRTLELDDDVIDTARAADGSLPGGISPDVLKDLVGNPELMALLQTPKMQDAMKLMMTGGQDSLERMMADDEEMYEIVTKLNAIMNKAI